MNIPISTSRDGVERLVEALESDKQLVEETNIEELELEIGNAVYHLTVGEREVVEEYLEVF